MYSMRMVTMRDLQAQGIKFNSGPGSTQFPSLVVFHFSHDNQKVKELLMLCVSSSKSTIFV